MRSRSSAAAASPGSAMRRICASRTRASAMPSGCCNATQAGIAQIGNACGTRCRDPRARVGDRLAARTDRGRHCHPVVGGLEIAQRAGLLGAPDQTALDRGQSLHRPRLAGRRRSALRSLGSAPSPCSPRRSARRSCFGLPVEFPEPVGDVDARQVGLHLGIAADAWCGRRPRFRARDAGRRCRRRRWRAPRRRWPAAHPARAAGPPSPRHRPAPVAGSPGTAGSPHRRRHRDAPAPAPHRRACAQARVHQPPVQPVARPR